LTFYKANRTYC